ncbi:hypothetical protein M3Y99_01196100 [Aphelenchoides fujianensis]|nr:hypothetical protein M3Y99_01196100 [Aphelenchoides fujianensis]
MDRKYILCPQLAAVKMQIQHRTYTSYRERWFVLLVVCLLALSNATIWIAFAPLHMATSRFYQNEDVTFWSSQIFQIVGIVFGVFGMFVTDRYGVKPSCVCGCLFNFLGAAIRVLSSLSALPVDLRLPVLYVGQTVAAMAQPFFLCLSTKVAEQWFAEDQRALANSLSFVANPLGVVVGSIAPVIFVSSGDEDDESNDILYLNSVLTLLALLVLSLCLGIRRSKPLTPPSASSECASAPPFFQGLLQLFTIPIYFIQMITFGAAFALQWSIFITADKMLNTLNYNVKVTSWLISLSAVSGCVGCVAAGWVVDKTKRFKEVIKTCYICVAIFAIAINLHLRRPNQGPSDDVVLVVLLCLLGFFSIPVFPISLELGVETTFPIAEATSSGVLIIAGQSLMFLVTYAMEGLQSASWIYATPPNLAVSMANATDLSYSGLFSENYHLAVDFWTISAIAAAIFTSLCLWPRYQRLEFEERSTVYLSPSPARPVAV